MLRVNCEEVSVLSSLTKLERASFGEQRLGVKRVLFLFVSISHHSICCIGQRAILDDWHQIFIYQITIRLRRA